MNDKLVKSKPARGAGNALVPVAAALLLVVAGGAWYGSYSQRWGPPADMVAASAKLEKLPRQFGDWSKAEDLPFDETTRSMLECAGFVNRRYINEKTRQAVSLAIIVGPPGPTSVHTPEICFSSRAFQQAGGRNRQKIGDAPGKGNSFWTLDFTSPNVLADGLRVYYAWSRGDQWEASESPRYEFAAAPYLYKLQLAAPVAAGAKAGDADVGQQFLEQFLQAAWPEGAAGVPD